MAEKNISKTEIIPMDNKGSILYISYDGLTDPLGQSQILPYLTNLSELSYKITIISAEKQGNFDKHKTKIKNLCSSANINWEPVSYTASPPIVSTLKDVKAIYKKSKELHLVQKFDIVHCRSYISALVGLKLKKNFGIKFLFDMRGFWADERVDGKIWNRSNPIFNAVYKFFKKKEKQFLENADHVISLTFNGKKEIGSWDNLKSQPTVTVIPCCADLDHFNYENKILKTDYKELLGIPTDDFVITYLGSIGTWYMANEMLDYFKTLSKFRSATFLFISKDDPYQIYQLAKQKGIPSEKVKITPSEREDLPDLLRISDASIFFILPVFSKKASSPTKQAELLGMGIPLICNSNVGDTNEIIQKENVGFVIDHFNEEAYMDSINKLNQLQTLFPKSKLMEVSKKHFSLKTGVKRYKTVYDSLL